MIKLLVLTTTFPRFKKDSTPAFVYELCKHIAEKNIDVTVLCPHDKDAKIMEDMDGLHVIRFPYFFPKKYQKLAYHGGILPSLKKGILPKIQIPFLIISEFFHAIKLIKKEKPSIIHSHWIIPSGLIGALCQKLFRIRHVMTIHAAGLFTLNKIPFKRFIADFIITNSSQVTVVSSYIKDELKEIITPALNINLDKKLSIIPMGVNTSDFMVDIEKNKLKNKYNLNSKSVLLYFGRLAEKKGIPYLIKAMPSILTNHEDIILVICGGGPDKNELETLVSELNIVSNVKFTGYISDEEKIEYFSFADILVVPSIVTSGGDTEGLPVVIMEGLAAGLPIIASDAGGIKDAIINMETGILIKQKSSDEIVKAVNIIMKNKELQSNLAERGKLLARNMFSWDKISDRYFKVLSKRTG